ncbi:hypothetical protein QFC21_000549 [Naganishia friedmannii]|uniref:Uncharacterized protein n=1 Tax=Naganishia friedmannii TaxID=89922 RepID=A0ACC2WCZ7_9TREE|nr:hypothetical protein QFC21_000549 [Naganishia friedmannii]
MSELSPLLLPHNDTDNDQDYATLTPRPVPVNRKRRTRATSATLLLTLTSLLLPFLLLSALLINSFIPSDEELAHLTDSALLYDPAAGSSPQVGILNFSSAYTQAWIEVSGKAGIDVDAILGINGAKGIGKEGRGQGAPWWEALRTWVGTRGIDMVGPLVVVIPESIAVFPQETSSIFSSSSPSHRHRRIDHIGQKPLLTVSLPTPIDLPLVVPRRIAQLPEHTYHLRLSINRPAHLLAFTHTAWRSGVADIAVHIPRVVVLPAETQGVFVWWRKWIRIEQKNLIILQRVDVPDIPGIPGPDDDLADYITLESYAFRTTTTTTAATTAAPAAAPGSQRHEDGDAITFNHNGDAEATETEAVPKKQLRVSAIASARNPFFRNPTLGMRSVAFPLELGFGIFLSARSEESSAIMEQVGAGPGAGADAEIGKRNGMRQVLRERDGGAGGLVKMAEVVTMPFSLHGQERIRIHVEGVVKTGGEHSSDTRDDGDSGDDGNTALSMFLNNYLQGRPNNVTILGLPTFPLDASPDARINMTTPPSGNDVVPPAWMQTLVSESVHAVIPFPAPSPNRTNLIRSVTIEQMKISERAGKMRASGVVVVVASLPRDLADIEVAVRGVLPDVLVSDGKFEGGDGEEVDPGMPPYPARAFGRIHPPEYLAAVSSPSPDDPALLIVRAPLHDVPLDILPGRDKVLSDFVTKIVFKGSAEAGIVGNAAVHVDVVGIGKEVEVRRLPISGVVNVGRPRVV